LGPVAKRLVRKLWEHETAEAPESATVDAILDTATEDGFLSFRRLIQATERKLLERP
jgi:hypothetical protein